MNQAAVEWSKLHLARDRRRPDSADPPLAEAMVWPTAEDIHFQAIAGDVRQAPGANGSEDVSGVVRNILDRVRNNIRRRASGTSD